MSMNTPDEVQAIEPPRPGQTKVLFGQEKLAFSKSRLLAGACPRRPGGTASRRVEGLMAFADRADAVLVRIRAELAVPMGARESAATDMELQLALDKVDEMKKEVLMGRLPSAHLRYPTLGRMIIDSWKLGSSLGNAISAVEHEYRDL